MRRLIMLGSSVLVLVTGAAAASLVDHGQQPLEGPARRYSITGDDTDGTLDPIPGTPRQLDGATMNRPDFYPEGRPDTLLVSEWRLFDDEAAARLQLEAWGYREGFSTTLQGPIYYVREQVHLFGGSGGAQGMYGALVGGTSKGGLSRLTPPDGLGDESVVFELNGADSLKPTQSGYRVVLRRNNLVVLFDVIGAKSAVTPDLAASFGRVIDAKATGRVQAPVPTPAAPPTAVAPARWVDNRGMPVPREVLSEAVGPRYCEMESVVLLTVGDRVFANDPFGVLGARGPEKGEAAVQLPASAVDTGYRSGDRRLWLGTGDDDAAYLVMSGGIERWPRLTSFCF